MHLNFSNLPHPEDVAVKRSDESLASLKDNYNLQKMDLFSWSNFDYLSGKLWD